MKSIEQIKNRIDEHEKSVEIYSNRATYCIQRADILTAHNHLTMALIDIGKINELRTWLLENK